MHCYRSALRRTHDIKDSVALALVVPGASTLAACQLAVVILAVHVPESIQTQNRRRIFRFPRNTTKLGQFHKNEEHMLQEATKLPALMSCVTFLGCVNCSCLILVTADDNGGMLAR